MALIQFFFAFAILQSASVHAHELPPRVSVQMIAAANGAALDLMVRVPLEAMRDVDFPLTPEGYLVLAEARDSIEDAAGLWVIDNLRVRFRGNVLVPDQRTIRLALPASRAFDNLATARGHFLASPLPASTQIFWRQVMLDVRMQYALETAPMPGDLTLDASFRQLGETTRVELLFVDSGGTESTLAFDGDARALALMPSAWRVIRDFVSDGFIHILGGIDHLLFLLCLVLPLRRLWPLVASVTAFTVAHSITLGVSALGLLPRAIWFPSVVEWLIAASIVYLALENILRRDIRRRWGVAFCFGLAHGFGFAGALVDSLQFAQGQTYLALAAFNVGVELGQLLVLLALLPLLIVFFKRVPSERLAMIVISTLIAHSAWHWMSERYALVLGYI